MTTLEDVQRSMDNILDQIVKDLDNPRIRHILADSLANTTGELWDDCWILADRLVRIAEARK